MGLRKLPERDGALNSNLKVQQELRRKKKMGERVPTEKKEGEQKTETREPAMVQLEGSRIQVGDLEQRKQQR